MLTKLRANPEFVLTFLITFAATLLYVYSASSTAQNAKAQCERNKQHIREMEASQASVATAVEVIKTKMGYIESSLQQQTDIQAATAGKVDSLNTMIMNFISEERLRRRTE